MPAFAEPFDPCPRLLNAEEDNPSALRLAWNWFADNETQTENVPPDFGENDFYVTVSPGRFVNVRCDAEQYEQQEMYPIGIVVKPIARVPLPVFENAHSDRAILVITEYGHRKIVREKHIQQIEKDKVYFFADSPLNAGICRTAEDCPGNEEESCKDQRKCRYVVSAQYGYAEADIGTAVRAIVAAFLLRRDAAKDPFASDENLHRKDQVEDVACRPIPVKARRHGGALHQPQNSYLSLCAKRKIAGVQTNAISPIKIVTDDSARAAFSWHLDGSFHRRLADQHGLKSKIWSALNGYQINSVKECGTEIQNTTGLDSSAGLKLQVSAGIVEASAGASARMETKITRTLSADDYLLMSTYIIEPIPNAPRVNEGDDNELWFFRVIFRSKCEDNTPDRATSIIIHYHRLSGGLLEVSASKDLKESYLEKWSDYAYAPNNSVSSLREGQFWTVADLQGYFIWRDTLRNFIEFENIVTSKLLDKHPPIQKPYVRDFFVYLMLTAAYHHRDPSLRGG